MVGRGAILTLLLIVIQCAVTSPCAQGQRIASSLLLRSVDGQQGVARVLHLYATACSDVRHAAVPTARERRAREDAVELCRRLDGVAEARCVDQQHTAERLLQLGLACGEGGVSSAGRRTKRDEGMRLDKGCAAAARQRHFDSGRPLLCRRHRYDESTIAALWRRAWLVHKLLQRAGGHQRLDRLRERSLRPRHCLASLREHGESLRGEDDAVVAAVEGTDEPRGQAIRRRRERRERRELRAGFCRPPRSLLQRLDGVSHLG
eukprot:3964448-Prymnesium_polylepis.2